MKNSAYIQFNESQLDKIGNTIVYLSTKIPNLSKTKLLKLLYILDEMSIKKGGIPFINLTYKLWKLGPVSEELFIDLSSDNVKLLESFIDKQCLREGTYIKPKKEFNDDEFTDNDIELLDLVIERYGDKNARQLIHYTHRANSPWRNTAIEKNVLDLLENEKINNTDFVIDMSELVAHDERKKEIYNNYLECH